MTPRVDDTADDYLAWRHDVEKVERWAGYDPHAPHPDEPEYVPDGHASDLTNTPWIEEP